MLRTGYVIRYSIYPVLWCSKVQIEIPLITTKGEYFALIQALHKVIPFMELMKKVTFIFNIHLPKPEVFCEALK